MDCSLLGSSVHGIFLAKILEWVAFPSPGDLPDLGIEPKSPSLADACFTTEPLRKPIYKVPMCKSHAKSDFFF